MDLTMPMLKMRLHNTVFIEENSFVFYNQRNESELCRNKSLQRRIEPRPRHERHSGFNSISTVHNESLGQVRRTLSLIAIIGLKHSV